MKSKIQIPQDILNVIDFSNTTNGGMTEPHLTISKNEDGYQISVKAAGLDANDFQVDVIENRLWVYHLVHLFGQRSNGDLNNLKAARTLGNLFLPNDVSVEEIVARYDDATRELNIQMPYSESKRNFRRHIDIEKW